MKNSIRKIMGFIKMEKRLFFAVVFLCVVFVINHALYIKHTKNTESCSDGKCLSLPTEKPQLTEENAYYYVDDLFKDKPSGYYRLTFQEKADSNERIILKLNTYSEKENQIESLILEPSDKFNKQELFFFLPDGFDSLLFQKENYGSIGNVFVKDVGITKLNVTNHAELESMKKTILSETDADVVQISQLLSEDAFPWLKTSKTVLGQIFQARGAVISAVALKIDINKNINPGSRQYVLSLQKVDYDGESILLSGSTIANVTFSVSSIEKYRQSDGTFLFPMYGILENNKHYLISLNNSKVEVGEQNYLELRGDKSGDYYADGSAVIKKDKKLYKLDGDLYFKIYGAELSLENGVKILNGAKIEDLGKGYGKYFYATKGKFADILDLGSASPGTEFSDDNKVIVAPAKDNASFGYIVNTLYPISKMNFNASQLKAGWKNVKVSYSFDQDVWIDVPFSEEVELTTDLGSGLISEQNVAATDADNGDADEESSDSSAASDDSIRAVAQEAVQVFDVDILPSKEVQTVYFKITYDPNDTSKGKSFALKNLKITADLKMK